MKLLVTLFPLFCIVSCKQETVNDLYDMLNDPRLLSVIEKRLKLLEDENAQYSDEHDNQIGCYEKSATLRNGCSFAADSDQIIKTNESLQRGAEFLRDYVNISCPRECTALCCEHPSCDTAVYQDKVDRKCFLFHCGETGACVFSSHSDYWRLTISEAMHNSHSYIPGGASHSHENELESLRPNDRQKVTTFPPRPSTTVKKPAPRLPGLNEECPSYKSECADKHAECLGTCRCRVGYHEKHGICRKLCSDEEFECESFTYGSDMRQCILNRYVCDDHHDCDDGSDEINCREKNQPDKKPVHTRPGIGGNRNRPFQSHSDKLKQPKLASTTHKTTEKGTLPTTLKPETPSATDPIKTVDPEVENTDSKNTDSKASVDTDESTNKESVSSEEKSGEQSIDESSLLKSTKQNTSDVNNGELDSDHFKILNVDSVEVESYTDSFQGPIVALALGLAITLMLLIIVGCRLRTVKRRLRKGRQLHSNEADYLINGMYL